MSLKRTCSLVMLFVSPSLSSCMPGPNGSGGGFMWLIGLVFVVVILYFLLQGTKSKGSDLSVNETPLDILKKRYAKGEIDKEEFDLKKKDLEY